MCEPGIPRLCCIVQYVSWCPYFMHCEPNHVGPVTSDATTCFSVKCGCARLQHHAPPLLPLLSHCSHSPCGGVVGGGTEVVGVPSTSQVAAYHARDTTATQQKVVCTVVPTLVLHCVFCCAVSPDCLPTTLLHPQGQSVSRPKCVHVCICVCMK